MESNYNIYTGGGAQLNFRVKSILSGCWVHFFNEVKEVKEKETYLT